MKVKTVRLTQMQIATLVAILEHQRFASKAEQDEIDGIVAQLRRAEMR